MRLDFDLNSKNKFCDKYEPIIFSTGGWTINKKSEVLNIWAFYSFLRLYKKVKTLITFLKLLCTLPYSKLKTFLKFTTCELDQQYNILSTQ